MNIESPDLDVEQRPVLIIDDDLGIRETLSLILESQGYAVLTASDGQDALRILKGASQLPGIILLDLMMPVMNGWQFLENVSHDERLAGIPIIVVTAFSAGLPVIQPKAVLTKPLNLNLLLETVAKYCI
ncbi:MAG: response regulator [Bdellovibrionia bacterium]